jgi:hypothetical protein
MGLHVGSRVKTITGHFTFWDGIDEDQTQALLSLAKTDPARFAQYEATAKRRAGKLLGRDPKAGEGGGQAPMDLGEDDDPPTATAYSLGEEDPSDPAITRFPFVLDVPQFGRLRDLPDVTFSYMRAGLCEALIGFDLCVKGTPYAHADIRKEDIIFGGYSFALTPKAIIVRKLTAQ